MKRRFQTAGFVLVYTGLVSPALGRPNTHPQAVTSWDVRASSLALQSTSAVGRSDAYRAVSLGASFTSSSGYLSAQFAAHYLRFRQEDPNAPQATGASLGGTLLLHLPFGSATAEEHRTALNLYFGALPTALVGIERNYLSAPLVLGTGLSFTPLSTLSITPWGEVSRSIDLDPSLRAVSTDEAIEAARDGELTSAEVENLVREGLGLETERNTATRFGLSASIHLSQRVNWDIHLVLGTGGASALGFGTGLVILWDEFPSQTYAARQDGASERQGATPAAPVPTTKPEPAQPLHNTPPRKRRGPTYRQVPNQAVRTVPPDNVSLTSLALLYHPSATEKPPPQPVPNPLPTHR